ncbi:cupin domain-containing protein [Pendulispora brunnea]|uniref:Cupin domain-containing protein n=1 Tax=Pendulispora brunnea TaxID=2905690 RepID=A0ABZ2KJF3_9BACT
MAEFRRTILGQTPYLAEPRTELANRALKALGIRSLDDVFTLRGAKAYAWFPMRNGRHAAAPIPTSSAKRVHDGGLAIYVRRIRECEMFEREVADSLRIPASSVECSVFCNPAKATTLAHFDRSDLLILQLSGRKTWRIAPNDFAPNPSLCWGAGDRVTPELRLYAPGLPPTEMPRNATSHVLETGSVLYLPRGYWHETTSEEDSLSLHMTVLSTTRIDVLMSALKNELLRDPYWREPAYDLSAGEPPAIEQAAAACTALRDAVSRIEASDLVHLPVPKGDFDGSARFARCGQVSFGIESVDSHAETARVVITTHTYREKKLTHIELSIEFIAACEWINGLASGTAFDLPTLLRQSPGLNGSEARELLGVLENIRLVRRLH